MSVRCRPYRHQGHTSTSPRSIRVGIEECESIGGESELVLEAVLDEREMPESCLDYRGDSTGIIKPDSAEWSFGSTEGC